MKPDHINALFEAVGALLLTLNIRQLLRDKSVAGVLILPTAFWTLWGVWNLYYYPSLAQWYSFSAGLAVVLANGIWVGFAVYYKRKTCARV